MYKHILVPTDGSELSDKAINAAIDFARETGARVTGFTAVPEYQVPGEAELMSRRAVSPDQHERNSQRLAQEVLGRIAERARFTGVEFVTDYVQSAARTRRSSRLRANTAATSSSWPRMADGVSRS